MRGTQPPTAVNTRTWQRPVAGRGGDSTGVRWWCRELKKRSWPPGQQLEQTKHALLEQFSIGLVEICRKRAIQENAARPWFLGFYLFMHGIQLIDDTCLIQRNYRTMYICPNWVFFLIFFCRTMLKLLPTPKLEATWSRQLGYFVVWCR
jgi:hypothetical protein